MIIRANAENTVRHVALLGLRGALMASLGTLSDGLSFVGRQVERVFDAPYRRPMLTQLRLLSPDGAAVRLAGGRLLAADGGIDGNETFRIAHVPAFELDPAETLAQRLAREAPVCEWLRRQRAGRALISASGSAVFVLAEAGLLTDGVASLPKPMIPDFRRRYPRIRVDTRAVVAEHDGIFTAGPLGAEWQLIARLVELAFSPQMAGWLAAVTGLRRTPDGPAFESDDPLVAGAQFWLSERFAETFKITDLARDLSVSHPTLIRRFQRSLGITPRDYAQRLRVDAAKRMLITTDRSIYEIGLMVGYADARAFRAVFREHTGKSPKEYRRDGA